MVRSDWRERCRFRSGNNNGQWCGRRLARDLILSVGCRRLGTSSMGEPGAGSDRTAERCIGALFPPLPALRLPPPPSSWSSSKPRDSVLPPQDCRNRNIGRPCCPPRACRAPSHAFPLPSYLNASFARFSTGRRWRGPRGFTRVENPWATPGRRPPRPSRGTRVEDHGDAAGRSPRLARGSRGRPRRPRRPRRRRDWSRRLARETP